MSEDQDKDKVIRLQDRRPPSEFSEEAHSWETHVDLCLQEQQDYIERLIHADTQKTMMIEDLHRDIRDLQRTMSTLLRQLYLEKKSEKT